MGVSVSTVIPGAVRTSGNAKEVIWSQLKSRYYAASDELHLLYRLDEYMTSGMEQRFCVDRPKDRWSGDLIIQKSDSLIVRPLTLALTQT